MPSAQHSHNASIFALELDGRFCGIPHHVQGVTLKAKLGTSHPATNVMVNQHIASLNGGDVHLVCGRGMSQPFYDWIRAYAGKSQRGRGVSILALDYSYKELQRVDYRNSLISGIVFPDCDASSKDPAYITLSFRPGATHNSDGQNSSLPRISTRQHWQKCDFRLDITGLTCTGVTNIEAVQVSSLAGRGPTLTVTVAESKAQSFYDWANSDLAGGSSSVTKTGTLTYLTPTIQTILSLGFRGLRLSKLTAVNSGAHGSALAKVKVEMQSDGAGVTCANTAWA